MKSKVLDIVCNCGFTIFKYRKYGSGTLIKCYRDCIIESNIEIDGIELLTKIVCPNCQKELGYWNRFRGKIALKLNNGTIKKIKVG
ncbi:MAG: hypothetical protein WC155_09465 [Candidatus Cloacimonadales bacterium]